MFGNNIKKSVGAYYSSFSSLPQIRELLRYLMDANSFSLGSIKRGMHAYLSSLRNDAGTSYTAEIVKPDGCLVRDMFNPALFRPGRFALHPSSYPLRPERLAHYHLLSCRACGAAGHVLPSCYFSTMLRCVTHGWDPPVDLALLHPRYRVNGNYPAVRLYSASVTKEIDDMLTHGVAIPFLGRPSSCTLPTIFHPLGAVLKNSDRMRAKVLVGIDVVDQASLSAASSALLAMDQPKIKCRVTTDATATGLNGAVLAPPFRYPSLQVAISMVHRGWWLGKCDISRYFFSFSFALAFRCLCCFQFGGKAYTFARVFFGFGPAPYFCSTWSAEFRSWFLALGITVAHMMDDFFVCEPTEALTRTAIAQISAIFTDVGLDMQDDKLEFGQELPFLGVLIDTNTMTLRFDATQSKGVRLQLESYLRCIKARKHLDHTTIRHVCGKLNWYSEVVQSGRIHIKSWWNYERHGKDIYDATLYLLIQDTQWWIDLLSSWEDGRSSSAEYRIMSHDELLKDRTSIHVIQSDASGIDGYGYYYSYLYDKDAQYTSRRWRPSDGVGLDTSSHFFELLALKDFLTTTCTARDGILIWLTDNEGCAWSVNKGSCRDEAAIPVLGEILRMCDQYRLQILALWVPRESNELADYLSHLAAYSNRDTVSGQVSGLGSPPQSDGAEASQQA